MERAGSGMRMGVGPETGLKGVVGWGWPHVWGAGVLSTAGEAAQGILSSSEPAGQVGKRVTGKARVLAQAFRGQQEVWPGWRA